MKNRFIIALLISFLFITSCSDAPTDATNNEEPTLLKISAAVSLTDALEEMKESYEKEHHVELSFNLAGSGTLAQQIQQGAPVDVFISANQNWMDTLEDEQQIVSNTREDVTGNNLVLIANKESSFQYESFNEINPNDVTEIAVGNPESVPAGGYTKDTLRSLDLWELLQDKIVLAKDVRQVLTYVETGNADIGFVYESDALSSDEIDILATAEAGHHDPIIYPGAIVSDTKNEAEATAFLEYMVTEEAQDILAKHGFKK